MRYLLTGMLAAAECAVYPVPAAKGTTVYMSTCEPAGPYAGSG
jgi:hypothetical protein